MGLLFDCLRLFWMLVVFCLGLLASACLRVVWICLLCGCFDFVVVVVLLNCYLISALLIVCVLCLFALFWDGLAIDVSCFSGCV